MAGDSEKLQLDVTAEDHASAVLKKVGTEVDKLEDADPEIEVTADTGGAKRDVDTFARQLDKLTDSDKLVVLALRAGQVESELKGLYTDVAQLDSADPEITVTTERIADASTELDQLKAKILDINDTSLDPDAGNVARQKLDGIRGSAEGAQGAVHSMAGNAIGDFAATATGIGPLGEAIGQVTEQIAGAELGFKQMLTAGVSMGGLAATMYVVQKAMKAIADTDAFHKGEVDAFTASIRDGKDAVVDLEDRLRETGKVTGAPSTTNASNWLGLSDAVRDVTDTLTAAGLTVEGYTALVAGSVTDIEAWAQAQKDAGTFTRDTVTAMDLIVQAQKDVATATDAATASSQFFEGQQRAQNAEAARWTALARTYKTATDEAAGSTDLMGRDVDELEDSFRRSSAALDTMRGNIDDDQMWLDLQDDFDAVRETGTKAWEDVRTEADTAEGSVRAHERATNDAKLALEKYATEVLHLPPKQVVDIVTNLDDAGLDETERRLAELKRLAEIKIKFIAGSGAGFLLTGSTTSASGTSALPSLSAAAAPARWARINGR